MTASARRALIVLASSHGQTRAIAQRLGDHLRAAGLEVEVHDTAGAEVPPSPAGFDAVVVGSRVQFGRHARPIARYVRRHRAALEHTCAAFFSVSMSASGPTPAARAQAAGYLERFAAETGWRPAFAVSFAGGLPYTRYGPLLRFVMRRISQAAGHPTDTRRDHVLTDWDAVRRFAAAVVEALARSGPRAAA